MHPRIKEAMSLLDAPRELFYSDRPDAQLLWIRCCRLRGAGVPRMVAAQIVANSDTDGRDLKWDTKSMRRLQDARADEKPLIGVLGAIGTGKTIAVCTLLDPEDIYVSATDVARLSDHYSDDRKRLDQLSRVKVLAVDELGQEEDRDRKRIEVFIHRRIEEGLVTFAIGNMAPDEFRECYGDRLMRRAKDYGALVVMNEPLSSGGKGLA